MIRDSNYEMWTIYHLFSRAFADIRTIHLFRQWHSIADIQSTFLNWHSLANTYAIFFSKSEAAMYRCVNICIFIWIYITILSESHYNTTECFQTHLLHCCYNATWELKGISVVIGENHNYKKFAGQSKVFPHHIFCSPASKIGRLLNLYCGWWWFVALSF